MTTATNPKHATSPGRLAWIDGRWHADGVPIHAGDACELHTPEGWWICVRIESSDAGRRLIAYLDEHGLIFKRDIHPEHDRLRHRPRR